MRSTEQLEVAKISRNVPSTADIEHKPARGDPLDLCGSASAGSRSVTNRVSAKRLGLAGSDPLDLCGSAPANPHAYENLDGTFESSDRCTLYIGSRDKTAFKARVISRLSKSVTDLSGGLHSPGLNPFSYMVQHSTNSPTIGGRDDSVTVPGVDRATHSHDCTDVAQLEPAYAPLVDAAAARSGSVRLRSPAYLPAPVPTRGAARDAPVSPTDAPT